MFLFFSFFVVIVFCGFVVCCGFVLIIYLFVVEGKGMSRSS